MDWGVLLKLAMPIISRSGKWLYERVVENIQSTSWGIAAGGAAIAILEMFGCSIPLVQEAVVASFVIGPQLLGTDKDKIADTYVESIKSAIEQKKNSLKVLAEAQAAQDAAMPKE